MKERAADVLDELDPSSILLMYLADELPARDRAEVDRRLAAEPTLRQALEELRSAQSAFDAALRESDSSRRLAGETMAIQRITRAMREHGVALRGPSEEEYLAPRRVLRMPRWAYPIAAAAAVGLILVARWVLQPDPATRIGVHAQGTEKPEAQPYAENAMDTGQDSQVLAELTDSFRSPDPGQDKSIESLRQEARELANVSQSAGDPLQAIFADPSWNNESDE